MPSELARHPSETHESMLKRGASKPLTLQAYEVAEYTKSSNAAGLTVLGAFFAGIAFFIVGLLS
jgi:hypothetical protein